MPAPDTRPDPRPDSPRRAGRAPRVRSPALWRIRALILGAALALPVVICAVLGVMWLVERGHLISFALGSIVLVAATLALGWLAGVVMQRRRRAATAARAGEAPNRVTAVRPDPDWSDHETSAFAAARARINARLTDPVDWQILPELGFEVVGDVAADLSLEKGSALDFTLPEALLLIDRVALRYRGFLRAHVPFVDQISVRTLWWLWMHRTPAQKIWRSGGWVWRGTRLALNPAWGVLREVERLMTSGLRDRLSAEAMHEAQIILLEEIARAAIELHSGRLRVADADLAGLFDADESSALPPPLPLRLVLAGQTGAGRSALLNALAQANMAETDMAPVAADAVGAAAVIDGVDVTLVEPPGLDGTPARLEAQLGALRRADLIIWVLRANRPARDEDHALRAAHAGWLAADPRRRVPPQVLVATGADLLLTGWPYAEHVLPDAAQTRLGAAMAAIAADMGGVTAIPVRATEPDWNIDTVEAEIAAHLDEAFMVQRNRHRLEAEAGRRPLRDNLGRMSRGLQSGARAGARLVARRLGR